MRCCERGALHRERGLNSRHVHIKKGLRVLTLSPPASLVSTQRPPLHPSPHPLHPSTESSERLYPNKDRRPGDVWRGGEGGGWVVEQRGEGVCMRGIGLGLGGGGELSNLGVHFGVWKTVGLFQLECNISTQHATCLGYVTLMVLTGGRERARCQLSCSPVAFFNTSSSGITGFKSEQH